MSIHMVLVVSLIMSIWYDVSVMILIIIGRQSLILFKITTAISYQKPIIKTHISHKHLKLKDYIHSAAGEFNSECYIWCYCDDFTDDIVQ